MQTNPQAALRGAGLRVTPGRVAVIEALRENPHSDAENVRRALENRLLAISIQSVHNVLADLSAAQIIRRTEPAGSAALYECRTGDNHHHVICSDCGAVSDVDCVHGAAPCLTPSNTSGFSINTAEVTFWGLCPDCQQALATIKETA